MSRSSSTDLCGGRLATAVPTAILRKSTLHSQYPARTGLAKMLLIHLPFRRIQRRAIRLGCQKDGK
jgi:hypothetical protein